jgi:glycosyltransferase involved in cell wall biosynthesis
MDGSRRLHADTPETGRDGAPNDREGPRPGAARAAPRAVGRLVIGIATTGRAPILTPTLRVIAEQARLPDLVIVSATAPEDVEPAATEGLPFETRVLVGPKGLCAQRNAVLDALGADDVVLFLDDDFLIAPQFLERLEQLFAAHPDVAMITGTVIADGVSGPGLSPEDGERILKAAPAPETPGTISPAWNGYGCNFAMRMAPIRAHSLRFDESLPLYGWLEDVDFSGQIERHGKIVRASGLLGVHLGTKRARSPGHRLGYSQIANPVYLLRKKTIRRQHAFKLMRRNMLSNLVYTPVPRPWTDSRGRLIGNLHALWDLARGRCHPERVRDL